MVDEGLEIVRNLRARHDGTRRNPYNEIECGDHYARAMAGWTVLDALSGLDYDGAHKSISFGSAAGPENVRYPFVVGTGWGTFARTKTASGWEIEISLRLRQRRIRIPARWRSSRRQSIQLSLDDKSVSATPIKGVEGVVFSVPPGFVIRAGQTLTGIISAS